MDLPIEPHDLIEITDESNDDQDVRLEDFMTAEELNAVFGNSPEYVHRRSHTTSDPPQMDATGAPIVISYKSCLKDVLAVFPDICHDHVKKLYDEHRSVEAVARGISLTEDLISKVLDEKKYPKERDRLNELKRKRMSELNSDDERAAKWKNAERMNGDPIYSNQARNLLQEDFPDIPQRFIDLKLKELGHLYATYLALDLAEETYDTSAPKPYNKLKKRRRPSTTTLLTRDDMSPLSNAYQKLKGELGAARTLRKKLQTERHVKKAAADAEAAEDKALRDSGQVMECACCFSDDITINKVTWCSADIPHAFCFDCAATNANTLIGLSRYVLQCMDSSGCKEIFSRQERKRFLDTKTIEKLERLQQQTELREANLSNLESCPFCDFAAICDPIEVDKEFRCGNPECEKVSCRRCRNVTHIPMSCEEFKKENGVSERHQIEEARTNAIIRQCPQCKSAIFKDGGCNKIMCSCGAAVCDYCGKDISKEKYSHFKDGPVSTGIPGFRGKCPAHDNDYERNQQNMEKAEKQAMEKIRKENPDLSEEDLRIKFRENVKTPPRGSVRNLPYAPLHHYVAAVAGLPRHPPHGNDPPNHDEMMLQHQGFPIPHWPDVARPRAAYAYHLPPNPVHPAPAPLPAFQANDYPGYQAHRARTLAHHRPPPTPTVPHFPRFDPNQAARGLGIAQPRPRRRRVDDYEDDDEDDDDDDEGWDDGWGRH